MKADPGNEIVRRVYAAKTDNAEADDLIVDYMGFIKAETARHLGRFCTDQDDELSIAMLAFYDAIQKYDHNSGAFISFAGLMIRNRLIDYSRRENKHRQVISLDQPLEQDAEGMPTTMADRLQEPKTADGELRRQAAASEISELKTQLKDYGITLADVVDQSPRQKRSLKICQEAIRYAREHPQLIQTLLRTRKLPLSELSGGANAARKTLERHRKYLIALLLVYSNGYDNIRDHLKAMTL